MFGVIRRSGNSSYRLLRETRSSHLGRSLKLSHRNIVEDSLVLRRYSKRPLGVHGSHTLSEVSSCAQNQADDTKQARHPSGLREFSDFQSPILSNPRAESPRRSFSTASQVPETNFNVSNSDTRAAWSLVQSSLSSPTGAKTVLLDPMSGALGLRLPNTTRSHHTWSSGRRNFSTKPPSGSKYKTSAKIPTPKSSPSTSPFGSIDPQALIQSGVDMTWWFVKSFVTFFIKLPGNTVFYITHPKERREYIQGIRDIIRKEVDHYWTGSKLLMADVRTARALLGRTLSGSTLTRRERKQLLRTVSDLFRLVPFSMFILIPMAEFALPLALRIFPNMMPSTFQDSLKSEENMKRELQSRIAMAQFFQQTLEELANEQKRIAAKRTNESPDNEIANIQEQTAASMLEFLDRARQGEMMPPDVIVKYAKYFQDDLTLDNMPRMQLVNMCRYMQLQPYGSEAFLRFQLRHKIRLLKEDDQRIIWEGIEALTKMELREACQERGMRSTGLSKEAYKRSLQQWLDLSVHKNVPISLLVMSRTFFLQEEMATAPGSEADKSVVGLADAISGLDKEVINEVILEVATSEEKKSNPDIRKIKLEVVTQQNEMIREEREEAEKKKKSAEKTETPPTEEVATTEDAEESKSSSASSFETPDVQSAPTDKTDITATEPEDTQELSGEAETLETEEEYEPETELSPAEMDAISQLLSADPVSKEREELARIKSAMQETEEEEHVDGDPEYVESTGEEVEVTKEAQSVEPVEFTDEAAAAQIERIEKEAIVEAEESTKFVIENVASDDQATETVEEPVEEEEEEPEEDPTVARLKKRVESMVDKIEMQLSDVEVKIGDKLHILDKDLDGVLSLEEMAECLHVVLKRETTMEEAMEIASTMDENADGVFTVQELIKWIETHKLVKLESEGRDADMDRIMESQASEIPAKEDTDEILK